MKAFPREEWGKKRADLLLNPALSAPEAKGDRLASVWSCGIPWGN
jgi:hypothetical protein